MACLKNKVQKCPHCETGFLGYAIKLQTYSYKHITFQIKQPGDWCNSCAEGVLSGSHLKVTQKIIQEHQVQIDKSLDLIKKA